MDGTRNQEQVNPIPLNPKRKVVKIGMIPPILRYKAKK